MGEEKSDWKQIAKNYEFIKYWDQQKSILFQGELFFIGFHPTFIIRKELEYLKEMFKFAHLNLFTYNEFQKTVNQNKSQGKDLKLYRRW